VSSTPPSAPPRQRPPTVIDPRFRQRRIEVRRLEGRRRLRVLLVLAGFALVGLLAWAAMRSPLLNVDHVHVIGATRSTPASISAEAGVHTGMAMVDVDEGGAATRLQAVPGILRAHVSRHWPGTVTITIVERVPVAAVPAPGGVAVVDRTGRILTIAPLPPPGLPVLLGLPPAGAPGSRVGGRAADLLAVAQAMPSQVTQRVAGVAAAEGQISDTATIVGRDNRVLKTGPVPTLAVSYVSKPFTAGGRGASGPARPTGREDAGDPDGARPGRPDQAGCARRARACQPGDHPCLTLRRRDR